MKLLIKIGGTLLDSLESRQRLTSEITRALASGIHVVVVHGGGKQMTRFLGSQGIPTHFVDGLRVTTPDVLDAVLKVLAGSVNQELVASFIANGALAVGLTGMDALITEARQMRDELGFVGKPIRSDPRLLSLLVDNGYLPVLACVAGDSTGAFYNVNADQMAVSVAAAIQADKLLFLTDVDGVRGEDNVVYPTITSGKCRELIDMGIATGGMRAKLEAAIEGLAAGIGEVVIAPGAANQVISQLLSRTPIGTRLVGAEVGVGNHG
ncbi:MAG: acetylglutamate kinase [Verrucomicrobiota bacterium]